MKMLFKNVRKTSEKQEKPWKTTFHLVFYVFCLDLLLDALGTWSTTWSSGYKTKYVITQNGSLVHIHIDGCNWSGCKEVPDAVVKRSVNDNYPSADGWMRASPLHRLTATLYLKKEGSALKLIYVSIDTGHAVLGK